VTARGVNSRGGGAVAGVDYTVLLRKYRTGCKRDQLHGVCYEGIYFAVRG